MAYELVIFLHIYKHPIFHRSIDCLEVFLRNSSQQALLLNKINVFQHAYCDVMPVFVDFLHDPTLLVLITLAVQFLNFCL